MATRRGEVLTGIYDNFAQRLGHYQLTTKRATPTQVGGDVRTAEQSFMDENFAHAGLGLVVRDTGLGRIVEIVEVLTTNILLLMITQFCSIDDREDRHGARK